MKYKRRMFLAGTVSALVILSGAITVSAASTDAYLVREMVNSDVTELQQALAALGYLDPVFDGYFGAVTEEAVCAFQSDYGLYVDGEAGPATLSVLYQSAGMMNSETSTPSSYSVDIDNTYLTRGANGSGVAAVQQALSELGYNPGVVDGDYGSYTEAAVRAFQQANGLYVDGEAGPATLAVLFGSNANPASNPTVSDEQSSTPQASTVDYSGSYLVKGDTGAVVEALQRALSDLGYSVGVPDGYYGDYTESAVRAFQSYNGLSVDGEAGPQTLAAVLGSSAPSSLPSGTITPSSSDSDISRLQQALVNIRMLSSVDAEYGTLTTYAVKSVQRMFGLPQSGYADPTTMAYIENYNSFVDNPRDVQGYYSNTNWLVYVNTSTNRMYLYNGSIWNWSQVYNWQCATGAKGTETTLGEYTVNFKGYAFGDDTFTCYYFSSFNGPYYIHSTLYDSGSWIDQDNRLGMNLSHGCVRLDTNNAYWFYNNIPIGTKVVITQ